MIIKEYQNIEINVWDNVQEAKGIIQIIHGAMEHIQRYEEVACFFNKNNYIVIGCNNFGHGKEVKDKVNHLYKKQNIIYRNKVVYKYIQKEYEGIPKILIGHSMGSLISRKLLNQGHEYKKIILTGPVNPNKLVTKTGLILAKIIRKISKGNNVSKLANHLMFKVFEKKSLKINKSINWLSTDDEVYERFQKDPECGKNFDNNYVVALIKLTIDVGKNYEKLKNKNVILFYGEEDVSSNLGKDLKSLKDVNIVKVKNMRHEIFNESDNLELLNNILNIINEKK